MSQQLLTMYRTLFDALWARISNMLGRITTHSLMERALFETTREFPLTGEIVLESHGINLTNLETTEDPLDEEEVREALNALVVNLVGVLAEQVGRTIAEQIAKKAVVPGDEKTQ